MYPRHSKRKNILVPALAVIATVALMIAAACYGPHDNSPTSPGVKYLISITKGNGATVSLGHPVSIGVAVTNDIGVPQKSVRVDFTIIEGTADLASTYSVTDTAGFATNTVTPKYAPGEIQIQAQVYLTTAKTVITCTGE
ncbi:hypothetical protein LLH00_18845 [bacterium]|nr:hypothetical protein [bacterium]